MTAQAAGDHRPAGAGRWTPDIDLLQAFDDGEWLRVAREYTPRLTAHMRRRVPDVQAREDVLQETLLGAVRGMPRFDRRFSFEQYLFGICQNRTIDHLRKRRLQTLEHEEDEDGAPAIEHLAQHDETPGRLLYGRELRLRARALLVGLLRRWVQETWANGQYTRLMVVEALLAGGWRNRDTWQRFGLLDETAVAGIKFRALQALRRMTEEADGSGPLLAALATCDDEATPLQLDVAEVWRTHRVSCPAEHWLARLLAGGLGEGQRRFLEFHLDEMDCGACQAKRDELARDLREAELQALIDSVRDSALRFLRAATPAAAGAESSAFPTRPARPRRRRRASLRGS